VVSAFGEGCALWSPNWRLWAPRFDISCHLANCSGVKTPFNCVAVSSRMALALAFLSSGVRLVSARSVRIIRQIELFGDVLVAFHAGAMFVGRWGVGGLLSAQRGTTGEQGARSQCGD
jgi:hypothetical protein